MGMTGCSHGVNRLRDPRGSIADIKTPNVYNENSLIFEGPGGQGADRPGAGLLSISEATGETAPVTGKAEGDQHNKEQDDGHGDEPAAIEKGE